jgi:maleylacetate reductase
MTGFRHDTLRQRILVGADRALANVAEEVAERAARRVLLIGSTRHPLTRALAETVPTAARIEVVRQHVPLADAEAARSIAGRQNVDLVVSIGGGSATGLAKAIALTSGLTIIAVPTTFAGSEATPMWGITDHGQKTTGTDPAVLPAVVVYDSALVAELPAELAVASAINAFAHGVDSLWAPRSEPLATANAEIGMRLLAEALPALTSMQRSPADLDKVFLGGYLASVAFAATGSGMHHKICHVLGGRFDLPHAPLHAAVLPHVVAYNAPSASGAADAIARSLGARDAVSGLVTLYDRIGGWTSLQAIGLQEADLDEAAELACAAIPESNPRPVDRASIRDLLQRAWAGTPPDRE